MKILGTGLNGLVGSRIVELLKDKYEFENLSLSTGVDITDRNIVLEKIKSSDAEVVLHLAAKTDVDGCELDKPLGEKGEAWKINVKGTQNIADGCLKFNKKLIYISTDFAFSMATGSYAFIFAPAFFSLLIIKMEGASRMSSVLGLKDKPSIPTVFPFTSPCNNFFVFW